MNIFTRIGLKLISSPIINMKESYQFVRQLQKAFVSPSKEKFHFFDRMIQSADRTHEIPVRIFHPKHQRSEEIILFFHGGGWVLGDIDTYTRDCSRLAEETGRVVLSVDYRKAPEHPYPQGFDDCYYIAKLLLANSGYSGNHSSVKLTIMGNSAGANLAAAVSLKLRDQGVPLPAKQILINPVTYWRHDSESPFKSVEENGQDFGLTAKKMQEYMEMYEPDISKRPSPYIAPLLSRDFTHQPNTLIISSEYDPLRDEGEFYGYLLEEAGNEVEMYRINNTVHNFLFSPINDDSIDLTYQLMTDFLNNH
ncbi:alpha/beta hydrolase [Aerococcaceae bacterium WGS1372]